MKHLIFLILLPFILIACDTSQAKDADKEEAARLSHTDPTVTEVGTTPVVHGNFSMELVSNGQLEAREKAVVPFRVQELITGVNVQESDPVNAGQVYPVEIFS